MFYEIHDSHGAPQCGCEVKRFTDWFLLEYYIEENPDVEERIAEMYATVIERNEPHYEYDDGDSWQVVLPDELPGMYDDAIERGYGNESTFDSWLDDMERWKILVYKN